MTDQILTYEDLCELSPSITKRHIEKVNDRIKEKLLQLGLVKECENHVPHFMKLATITGSPQFETFQYGYRCSVCNVRLHPSSFVKYDPDKHSQEYRRALDIIAPKMGLAKSEELQS